LHEIVGDGSTVSAAVTVNVTEAPAGPVAARVIDPGTEIVGALVSTTWTSKVAGAEVLPESSLAVHDTVVVPTGKVLPEA
jgi:hypothetical protein